ncbi:MAG: SGNH/GDSL hydrolase family protein [Planctomycetes bacterium]|nr:SGNH/GDSL hydrolase family protein [Planctomycetota bacterium]
MNTKRKSIFEKNRKKTIAIIILIFVFLSIALLEFLLQVFMGLGHPVLYDSNPLYGYRPLPNREYSRFYGSKIKFNNLSLRAENDWNDKTENKILFLGDSVTYGGSYISNKELFSCLAAKDLGDYESGNAGVNGWGIENIYGLVVETGFLPADIYVTTVPEDDFYRGITKLQGLPFFNNSPKFALAELWLFFCCNQNNKRYKPWQSFATEKQIDYVAERAVKKLKELDVFIREKGFRHLIFITPSRDYVLKDNPKPLSIQKLLAKYSLKPVYISDELQKYTLSRDEMKSLYHDRGHLTSEGHQTWAKIIRDELTKLIDD